MSLGVKILSLLIAQIVICLIAPISISIGTVPITLQTFILFLVPLIFGKKIGLISGLIYLLIGALGLPVFGNYSSGWEKLIGATAGFLWAFPLVAYYVGWEAERKESNFFMNIITLFRAHILLLIPGFIILYLSIDGVKIWETLIRLLPGLMIKAIIGGILSAYILKNLPPKATNFLHQLKSNNS